MDKTNLGIPIVARASVSYMPIVGPNGEHGAEYEEQAKVDYLPKISEMVGSTVEAKDVHLFKARVINTKLIAFGGRFTPVSLPEAVALMPGAPLMMEHNYDTAPIGKHFMAQKVFIDNPVDSRDENYWGEAYLYVPNDPEGTAIYNRVKLGIYDQSSAAWAFLTLQCSICKTDMRMCGHWPMQVYDPGGLAYFNMENIQKYYESSIVFQGASQGTHMVPISAGADPEGGVARADGSGGVMWTFADEDAQPVRAHLPADHRNESRRFNAWLDGIAREFGGVMLIEDLFKQAGHEEGRAPTLAGCSCGVEDGVARGRFVLSEAHDNCRVEVFQCETCEGYDVGWQKRGDKAMSRIVVRDRPDASPAAAADDLLSSMFAAAEKQEATPVTSPRRAQNTMPVSVKKSVQSVVAPKERFGNANAAAAWMRWRGFSGSTMQETADAFVFTQWGVDLVDGEPKSISLEPSRKVNPVTAVIARRKQDSTEQASAGSDTDTGQGTLAAMFT